MKNPWMSMWLSAANSWSSAARGFWAGEMARQQAQMMNEMTKQITQFWLGPWGLAGYSTRKPLPRRH